MLACGAVVPLPTAVGAVGAGRGDAAGEDAAAVGEGAGVPAFPPAPHPAAIRPSTGIAAAITMTGRARRRAAKGREPDLMA